MKLRRKMVLGLTSLLAVVPLAVVPSASADVAAQSCRDVDVANPTGGADILGRLCWTARGDGWYDGDGARGWFASSYGNGKGLYMRACLINGDSVHDCGAWQ